MLSPNELARAVEAPPPDPKKIIVDIPAKFEPWVDPHRYKVAMGGRGGTKSWTIARLLILEAAHKPIKVLCARELQSSIADSVHALLKAQIEALGLQNYFVIREKYIKSHAGAHFMFHGIRHDPEKIKSMEGIDIAWVEEAHKVTEESWKVLIPTVRKPGSEIWISFNPKFETDPTFIRFAKNQRPDQLTIVINADDNPWLPEELKKEREYDYKVDPEAAANIWGGECLQHNNAQIFRGKWSIQSFKPVVYHEDPAEIWDGPYFGADFGFSQDPSAAVKVWIHKGKLYVEFESYHVGLELNDTAKTWKAECPGIEDFVAYCDNARPETISHLRNGVIDPKTGKREHVLKTKPVKKWAGSVQDGITFLRGFEEIVIHDRCKHAEQEFRLYSYKVDRLTGDVRPEIVDKHNHIIDAIRYALFKLIRRSDRKRVKVIKTKTKKAHHENV